MAFPNYISGFIAGVVSPYLYGRVDDQLYNYAAEKLDNFVINPTGSIKRRSGSRYIHDLSSYRNVRLIPFRFSSNQTLMIILADNRMFIATNGQMLMSGSSPYSISTPFSADQLDGLHYSQNADVITFTSTAIAPVELRRYGATNWQFKSIETAPSISPPSSVSASASYPEAVTTGSTKFDDDNYNPDTATMDTITATYVVTSVDENGRESTKSTPVSLKCNYYITGAYVNLEWDSVPDAAYYRVYRMVSGVYCFLSQTDVTSIRDEGTTPDASMTPPKYTQPFTGQSAGRITSISVINGGSGYRGEATGQIPDNVVKDGYLLIRPGFCFKRDAFTTSGPGDSGHDGGGTSYYRKIGYITCLIKRTDGTQFAAYCKAKNYEAYYDYEPGVSMRQGWYNYWASEYEKDEESGAIKYVKLKLPPEHANIKITGDDKMEVGLMFEETHYPKEPLDKRDICWLPSTYQQAFSREEMEFYQKYKDKAEAMIKKNSGSFGLTISDLGGRPTNYDGDVPLTISDSTGTGAGARGIVKDGRIDRVVLEAGGSGYSSPNISVRSQYGSGASFSYTLSSATPPEYPACSCQFDQRRVFAGTAKNPVKIFMTATGSQYLMTYHVPMQPDDMIEIIALTNDADIIKHAIGMESLLLMTGSSELRVYTQDGSGLSPQTVAVRAQSYVGASDIQPQVLNSSIVYISSRGNHPRQLTASGNGYNSEDLAIRCPHLFDQTNTVDLTISKAPIPQFYCTLDTGDIAVCTFVPEQKIVAWSEFRTEEGKYLRACAVAEGEEDRLYVVVERNIGGAKKKYLEHMAHLNYTKADARILDSYLEGSFTTPQQGVSGLNHLNGRVVYALVDGEQQGPFIVNNGAITLSKAGRYVIVGIPIKSRLVTVPLEYPNPQLLQSTRGATKAMMRVGLYHSIEYLDVYNGKAHDVVDTSKVRAQHDNTKLFEFPISRSYNNDFKFEVRTDDVFPLEIYSVKIAQAYNGG